MRSTLQLSRIITAALFLVVGIVTLWQAWPLPFGTISAMKPGFFPKVFGVLLTVLSLVMLIQQLFLKERQDEAREEADSEESVHTRGLISFIILFVLFVILTYIVGFIAATVVAVAGAGYLLGLRGWRLLLLTAGTAASTWLVFDLWLNLSLPLGLWS